MACGLVALITFLLRRDDPGPIYDGETLSTWVLHYAHTPEHESLYAAPDAIRSIGTNALPYLVKWLPRNAQPSRVQRMTAWTLDKIPAMEGLKGIRSWADGGPQNARLEGILLSFGVLGPNAAPAIPDLVKLANAPTNSLTPALAVEALGRIGLSALPALIQIVTNKEHAFRLKAMTNAAQMGAPASAAIPFLIHCLDENDFTLVHTAVYSLADMGADPRLVVPALTNLLQRTEQFADTSDSEATLTLSISMTLKEFGLKARDAAPVLIQHLKERPLPADRAYYAHKNIAAITDSPEILLPLLTGYVNNTNNAAQTWSAAKLGSLGPQAAPALTNAMQTSTGRLHLIISNSIQQIVSSQPAQQ